MIGGRACAVVVLLGCAAATAQAAGFPRVVEQTLPNGLRVLVAEMPGSGTVDLRLVFGSGSAGDPAGQPGLTRFTIEAMRASSAFGPDRSRLDRLVAQGGGLTARLFLEAAAVGAHAPSVELENAVVLLANAVLHPVFSGPVLAYVRDQLRTELALRRAQPDFVAREQLRRALFGAGHPYARPLASGAELGAIDRQALERLCRTRFLPNHALLLFVGDVRLPQAVTLASQWLGGWARGEEPAPSLPPLPPPARLGIELVPREAGGPGAFELGSLVPRGDDPDYLPLLVTAQILSGHPLNRLAFDLHEHPGVGHVRVEIEPAATLFAVFGTLRTKTIAPFIKGVLAAIRELGQHPLPAEDVDNAKAYLGNLMWLATGQTASVARMLVEQHAEGLPDDYWQTYMAKMKAVDAAAVQRAVRRFIVPAQARIVVVGPRALAGPLGKVAPVEVLAP